MEIFSIVSNTSSRVLICEVDITDFCHIDLFVATFKTNYAIDKSSAYIYIYIYIYIHAHTHTICIVVLKINWSCSNIRCNLIVIYKWGWGFFGGGGGLYKSSVFQKIDKCDSLLFKIKMIYF